MIIRKKIYENKQNSMTVLARTLKFVAGEQVDYPPFHPIIMRWAAKYAGIKYSQFCTDPHAKSYAMIRCARDFDTDHHVPSLEKFSSLLSPNQVFSGKSDPVNVIRMGSGEQIKQSVISDFMAAEKRCIISAGCEITPETSRENMHKFGETRKSLPYQDL